MKVIKRKLLQKAKGRKKGKYQITLELTDYDIEMFEDLAMTYAPFEEIEPPSKKNKFQGKYAPEFNDKYRTWMGNVWRCFCSLWRYYDEY